MSVEIVAEIGVNANGITHTAIALIDAAVEAGANTVKFQATYPRVEMSERLMPERIAMTERVILTHGQLNELIGYCERHHIEWLCTPSESESLRWLTCHAPSPARIKIGSDNLTNLPFLNEVALCRLPVILSTGMGTPQEIASGYHALRAHLPPASITLLHCTSAYPCPLEDANLCAMVSLRWIINSGTRLGWSDHTTSPFLGVAAVALGASMLEKHITLNPHDNGPDHATSLDPLQFATMVRLVRETEIALGDGNKRLMPSEAENALVTRKSLVAVKPINEGELLTPGNVGIMRPGVGRPPSEYFSDMGKAARSYEKGELI